MFNLKSPLFTRVSRWMSALLVAGLFTIAPIAAPNLLPSSEAAPNTGVPTTGGLYLDKTKPSYFTVSASANFELSSSDNFTIAWWQYANNTNDWPRTFSLGSGSNNLAISQEGGTFYLWRGGSWFSSFTHTSSLQNNWVHYAIVRSGGTLKVYEDGVQKVSVGSHTYAYGNSTSPFYIGTNLSYSADQSRINFGGYLTGFEFIKGTAKYSGTSTTEQNFMPASTLAGYTSSVTSGTKLLLFPTNSGTLFSDLSGSGGGYTFTNVVATANNPVTYGSPTAVSRTITFDVNGGTGAPSATSLSGTTITLPTQNTLLKSGFAFGGWNTKANGTGFTFAAGDSYSPGIATTLYARWLPLIAYDKNGNTTSSALVPTTQGLQPSPSQNTLTTAVGLGKDGYTFGGWNTASNGKGTSYASTNSSLVDLPAPYLRLEAENYNTSTNQWVATNGSSISSSSMRGTVSKVTSTAAAGTSTTFPVVKGARTAGIILTTSSVTNYTFCTVARVPTATAVGAGNGGRLFEAATNQGNWLSGWWAGYQNQFFHAGWISNPTTVNDTNFHLLCDRSDSVRWDGNSSGTSGGTVTNLPPLTINYGGYTYRSDGTLVESSDWEVAEVLIYDQKLSDAQVLQVEAYLKHRYGVTNAASSVAAPVAYTTFETSTGVTLYAQWNSTITYSGNSNTSGTVPTPSAIPQGGGTLALNTGTLARSGSNIVGWNTRADGQGTRYAFGAAYTPSGNTTLYAQYESTITFPTVAYNPTTLTVGAGSGGRSDTFTATGGYGTRTFSLSPVRSGFSIDTSTANGVALVVSPVVANGTYLETLTVTDAAGFSTNHVITVTVATSVRFDTSTATSLVTSYGRSTSLRLNTTGGVGTKVFTMTAQSNTAITLDTTTAGSSYATLKIGSTVRPGTYSISLSVTDSTKIKSSLTVSVTVNPLPNITYTSGTVPAFRTNNLVIHYDIRNALSYSGTGTTVADLAGSTNATITSSAAYSSEFGGNLNITGGNYIGTDTCLANIATGIYSHFMWVNPRGNGIVLTENNGGWHTSTIEVNGGAFKFRVYNGTILTYTMPSLNRWYYIGLVYDGANEYAYVNGVQIGTAAMTRSASTVNCLGIGRSDGTNLGIATSGEFLFGALHSYTVALTASEALSNYEATQKGYLVTTPKSGAFSIETTQGLNTTYSTFTASDGTRIKTFGISPTVTGITIETGTANSAVLRVGPTAVATTSTSAATYLETLTATDEVGATTKYDLTIKINPPIVITASTPLTLNMTSGRTAYDTFTATYGTGTKTFTGVSSSNASAFVLASSSTNVALLTISGSLPAGTYYETVTATDSVGATARYVLTIVVNPAMTVAGATSNAVATTVGRSASLRINVTGGTSTRTLATTNVTAGITIDSSTITSNYVTLNVGTTLTANTYSFVITATDLVGATSRETFTVTVNALPTITTSSTTIATTQGIAATLTGSTSAGGTGNKTFAITGLNTGVSIDTSTTNAYSLNLANTLTSTSASVARTLTETVTATDAAGAIARQAYTITVNPLIKVESTTGTITTTSGIIAWDTFTATLGTGNKTFSLTGTPSITGFTLTQASNRAVLKVEATVNPGTYSLTITTTDAVGATTTLSKTVVVNALPTITGNTNIASTTGYAFSSQNYSAVNGTGSLTYSLSTVSATAGRPTSGITLSATTGSPTINVSTAVLPDTYTVTLRATDSLTAFGTFLITLRINETATITGTRTLTKVYGEDLSQVFATGGGTAPWNLSSSNICTSAKSTYTDAGVTYTVETFNGVGGCNWVAPTSVTIADVLVVAGGGGGGSRHQGGGGAGGVMYATNYSLTPGSSYALSVGGGGAGHAGGPSAGNGSNGENSFFGGSSGTTSIVATGGGGSNAVGGSGGGRNYQSPAVEVATPGTTAGTSRSAGTSTMTINGVVATVTAYGQAGAVGQGDGLCKPFNTSTARGWCGGGGGGASTPGTTPGVNSTPQWRAGNGGNGQTFTITGSSIVYGGGGGGGAGSDSTYTTAANCALDAPREGFGGSGGGGNGSKCQLSATNGTPGLGGGGGGGGYAYGFGSSSDNARGGNGGSGTVIVRYVTPAVDTQTVRITMDTLSETPTGLIRLNAPRLLPVNTYTQTITARDSSSAAPSVVVTLVVTKATPTLSLSLPGSVTTAKYGSSVTISATATTPGTVAFVNGSTNITACTAVATSAGLATCSWTPTVVGSTTLKATLTPTDTANYNSSAQVNLAVTVTKADTLTVTVASETFTYSGSAVSVTRGYTLSGLAAIDSITAISMVYSGTANTNVYRSDTTAPTDAGTYSIAPNYPANASAYTFVAGSLGTTSSISNYESVTVVAGTLTINRQAQLMTFTYANSGVITYSPTATIASTATSRRGAGEKTYTSFTPTKCSIASTAFVSVLEAGTCRVNMIVAQTANYLGDTATATITINKASRTFALTPAVSTLKYGDTTTVTATLSGGSSDGAISYTLGTPTGCDFDSLSGILTATSGTVSCPLSATISEGVNYLAETTTAISLTIAKANAPVITIDTVTAVSHIPATLASISPTYSVAGFKNSDAVGSMTFTYGFVSNPFETFTYSDTRTPIDAGTYSITPSQLTLSVGSIDDYETPNYASSAINFTINRIDQESITVINTNGEIEVPFTLMTSGGSTDGALTFTKVSGDSCSVSGASLTAIAAGSCVITVTMEGNRNYLAVTSETITVRVRNYVIVIFTPPANASTGISIPPSTATEKGSNSCTTGCVPKIISADIAEGAEGDLVVLTGISFNGVTKVYFNIYTEAPNFNVDSDTQISVRVPANLPVGDATIEVKSPGGTSPRFFDFYILP